jgi:hypothetical protein
MSVRVVHIRVVGPRAASRKVASSIPDLSFFNDIICGAGIHSAPNRNECQEYFLGSEGGRCPGLTALPSSCADCLENCEPQPPGRFTASTVIASPLKRVATAVILSVKAVIHVGMGRTAVHT